MSHRLASKELFFGLMLAFARAFNLSGADRPQPGSGNEAKGTFWIIPHTHWEGAVFKTREEYLEMGLPHILTALRLLKEHPGYRFTLDQVAYFKPFLERYPEEADAFRKFVAEGRLQIVGGTDVMPDDNMPSGESFVRQILYAKSYCREALGVDVKVGWMLDTFGHNAQMPQMLREAGLDSFWYFRGVKDDRTEPVDSLWQGLDGTIIRCFKPPFVFYRPPNALGPFTSYMKSRYDNLGSFERNGADRVDLDGLDVSDPEVYVPGLVERFNEQPDRPFDLHYAVPSDYEAAAAGKTGLPVFHGERNPIFQGAYSSRIELKQRMRNLERLLTTAEKFGAMASLLGARTDNEMTGRAWEPALFNVTHDLASGVMTDEVYADTVRGYDFSQRLAEEMIDTRLDDMLARIDTRGQGAPLIVFNTLGWQRTDAAKGDVGFAEGGIKNFELLDAAGGKVPAQMVEAARYDDGGLRRVKFIFLARDVPALGYAVYHVVPQKTACEAKEATAEAGNNVLENEFYKAAVELKSGALTSLRLKAGDWEAVSAPANVVAREQDNGDFWELYQNLNGSQSSIMTRPLKVPQRGHAQFSDEFGGQDGKILRGPVFSEFTVAHPLGSNGFATTMRIYQGIRRVEFQTTILNKERFVRYRVLMATTLQNGRNLQEIPFGAIERPRDQEFPAQNWIDYSDGSHGITVMNRGLPGNNVSEGTLMLSLLRSSRIQAYGIGGGFEGQASDTGLEMGQERTFEYALMPHAGDWRAAEAYRAGWEFNNPLIARKSTAHAGSLPGKWGLLEVSAANVVVSAVKQAQDGSTIVRVYEAGGRAATNTMIKLKAKIISARETNLIEDPEAYMEVRNNTLEFDLHPFEIKTFKLRLKDQ
jgi:alpha-mannosidase